MLTANSFTDGFVHLQYVLIANTLKRSLDGAPTAAPENVWMPTSRTSIGCAPSLASWMPHAYTSALPSCAPLFVSGTVVTLPDVVGVPAATFETPRGTTMN